MTLHAIENCEIFHPGNMRVNGSMTLITYHHKILNGFKKWRWGHGTWKYVHH